MAAEIIAIRSRAEAAGEKRWTMLYIYPLATPVLDALGTTVVHQTAAELPGEVAGRVPDDKKAAISAGNALFQAVNVAQTPGETDAAFLTRVRADYAARRTVFEAGVREAYARAPASRSTPNAVPGDPAP